MKTLTFQTTIKCQGCVETIAPSLDGEKRIKSWEVDLESPKKILKVETDLAPQHIEELLLKVGYESIREN